MIKVRLFHARLTALTALFGILMTLVWALPQSATATTKAAATKAAADTPSTASTVPTHPLCARPDKPNEMACFAVARDDVRQTGKGLQPLLAPAGLGPADLQSAYDLPSDAAGAGATVAIVDAYDNPNAEADLAVYRSQFGLPPCTTASGCFRKTDQRGGTDYPQPDAGWSGEIALDLDMVSAACPLCHILLVEADDPSIDNLGETENTAVALGATYVSNSWGGSESAIGDLPGDAYYRHPGVAITFSTGDLGYGTSYPASLPYVTAVGGTSLSRDSGSTRGWTESAWTGAGSGCSAYYPKPSFQTDRGCAGRAVADVSAVADPATGVSVYNTYEDRGWGVYGGTSASAPIIAATYALAGTPGAKSYPNAYPYAHTGAPDDALNGALNDVTSGTNGTCATADLCTAGPGWDGPTGLGTPNGTAAFTTGPYGMLTGKVTDPDTGDPVAGVRITAGANATTTGADGTYDMTLPAGTYDVTAAKFGYGSAGPAAVEVGDGASATRDFTLTAQPLVTVSGRIRDGSGHGWPLSAGIQVTDEPSTRTYTDPATGRYTLKLPANSTYTLQVDPVHSGYQVSTSDLTVGATAGRKDFDVPVDAAACVAPGYRQKFTEGTETFDGTGAPDGWSVTGSGHTWRFDDPAGRGNLTGGSGGFAIADSGYFADGQHTSLVSPVLDLTGHDTPAVRFDTFYRKFSDASKADVDLSVDGGTTWSTVWHRDTVSAGPGTESIALPAAAGKSAVRVRFRYTGDNAYYWQVDDVAFGGMTCAPVPGGLLYGTVTDRNTGRQVSGATVSGKAGATVTTAGDGTYVRFVPRTGRQQVAVSAEHYTTATKKVSVKADHATRLDAALRAGRLAISPAAVDRTVRKGKATTAKVTLRNTGSAPLAVSLTERSGDIPTATTADATAPQYVPGDYSPDRLTKAKSTATETATAVTSAASGWTSVTDYPTPVMDNAVATGPDGRVYSVGGIDGTSVLSGGYVYDPVTAAWTALPGGPATPREAPQSAFLNGKLYVTGGWTADGATVPTTDVYDPQHHTWSTAAPAPAGYAAAASATLDGKWYLVGGCGSGYCSGTTAMRVYDPATDTWAAAAPYPEAVSWLGCGAVSGTLYCAGGVTAVEGTRHGYAYDPATAAWTPITDLPTDLWASAATTADGRFLLSGGASDLLSAVTSAGYAYDPAARTWTALPAAATPLYRAGGACGFYRVGGAPSVFDARANVERLPGLDSCVPATDVRWLSAAPVTHTLAPGQRLSVTVRLDAGVTAVDVAGTYTAALAVGTDTPYTYPVVPVRMTVRNG